MWNSAVFTFWASLPNIFKCCKRYSDRLTWGIWTTFSVTDDLNIFQLFTLKSIHRLLSKTKGPISLPILLLICYDKYNKNIHMTGNNNNSHFTFKVKPIWNRIFFSHIRHNGLKQTKWMILRWKYAKCGTGFSRKYTLEQQFFKNNPGLWDAFFQSNHRAI